jgi:hypothetical protein
MAGYELRARRGRPTPLGSTAVDASVARMNSENTSSMTGVATMRWMAVLVLLGALVLAACSSSVEGNGDVVTETRSVSAFDAVHANNGVQVSFTIDPAATGDVNLEVTTDSNLQEFLTTEVTGNRLTVSADRTGGVSTTEAFEVSGIVAVLTDVSADNGAQLEVTGTVGDVTVSADNGARINAEALTATTAAIEADNGAQMSVCASGAVSGEVRNGARLTVLCGGSFSGVETSDGGTVSSTP